MVRKLLCGGLAVLLMTAGMSMAQQAPVSPSPETPALQAPSSPPPAVSAPAPEAPAAAPEPQTQDAPAAATPGETPANASGVAAAEDGPPWRHGLSLLGELKYPEGFPHFDYVNPDAPKGGLVRMSAFGTFDSFNPFITRGNAAAGVTLIYDNLMSSAYDEASSEYGLLASAVRYPEDFAWVTYRLRPEARWHDGRPVTAADVIWSFDTLKRVSPFFNRYYRNVTAARETAPGEVTFTFDGPGNRELPQIVGQLPVLPKHWWEGTDAQGRQRDFSAGALEPPLGSGPYRIKSFTAARTVSLERVPDYWGADLPVNRGKNNFDEIRFEYFRDQTVALEAFKADQYDFRLENSAKEWATAYEFPAAKEGKVKLETFADGGSGLMQAFVMNLRREKFADVRVRKALNLAFDFESMNRTLFYDQYERIDSFFYGTDLAASGLPVGLELEALEPLRAEVPGEVFTTEFTNPGADPERRREHLREATALLAEAGWTIRTEANPDEPPSLWTRALSTIGLAQIPTRQVLRNARGEPFTIEFLVVQPNFERVVLFYREQLDRLGIEVSVRVVDDTQYINRVRERDFDMITSSWAQSLSPGNEQRDFWGSDAADEPGSRNYAGIKDPAVDKLIDRVIFATDRDALVAATHALDRVLLWNYYVIPQWSITVDRTARWDRFAHPDAMPERGALFPMVWWRAEDGAAPPPPPAPDAADGAAR